MSEKPRRFSRFFIILLLVGIFFELLTLIGIFRDRKNLDGNIGIVALEGTIEDSLPTIEQLKAYEENEQVKAIVLRVNSPGGTVGASQEIHDEIKRINAHKKIVVSFGDMAASGGYYSAACAEKIVANPGTLTGSIGVIATFFVVDDVLKKLMLKWEVIKGGTLKDMASPLRKMTSEEKKVLEDMTLDIHDQFIMAVAEGRKLPKEKVIPLADGRVFSGRQAKTVGLVDELGGLEYAITLAAKISNLKDKPDPIYPQNESFGLLGALRGQVSSLFGFNHPSLSVRVQAK